MNRRTCKRCGFSKPLNAQNFWRGGSSGFAYLCKPCARDYAREWRYAHIVQPVQAQRAAARERGLLLIAEFREKLGE